jgi:protein-tyrosine phosphatase
VTEVVSPPPDAHEHPHPPSAGASLGLAKATNARDLGGYTTSEGRQVRRGLLFRSNTLHRLSDEDVAVLAQLNLGCVIDFRHPLEKDRVGPDRLPEPAPSRLVALPVFEVGHEVFLSVSAAMSGQSDPGLADQLRDHANDGSAAMRKLYRWFVSSPLAQETFGAALRLVATPDALPLLYHCSAGKDRTGWLSAIVLSALGVDRATIEADYLRTNDLNATGNTYLLSVLSERTPDTSVVVPLLEARTEYLDAAFDEVDRRFGGLDGYLRDGLLLSDDAREAMREALLTPAVR